MRFLHDIIAALRERNTLHAIELAHRMRGALPVDEQRLAHIVHTMLRQKGIDPEPEIATPSVNGSAQ